MRGSAGKARGVDQARVGGALYSRSQCGSGGVILTKPTAQPDQSWRGRNQRIWEKSEPGVV